MGACLSGSGAAHPAGEQSPPEQVKAGPGPGSGQQRLKAPSGGLDFTDPSSIPLTAASGDGPHGKTAAQQTAVRVEGPKGAPPAVSGAATPSGGPAPPAPRDEPHNPVDADALHPPSTSGVDAQPERRYVRPGTHVTLHPGDLPRSTLDALETAMNRDSPATGGTAFNSARESFGETNSERDSTWDHNDATEARASTLGNLLATRDDLLSTVTSNTSASAYPAALRSVSDVGGGLLQLGAQPRRKSFLVRLISNDALHTLLVAVPPMPHDVELRLRSVLRDCSLWRALTSSFRATLVRAFTPTTLAPGESFPLHSQRDGLARMCVLLEGEADVVDLLKPGRPSHRVTGPAAIGEANLLLPQPALLSLTPRAGPLLLYTISSHVFQGLRLQQAKGLLREKTELLANVQALQALSERDRDRVLDVMQRVEFRAGEVVYAAGQPAQLFYMVSQGKVSVTVKAREMARFGFGGCFGEEVLLDSEPGPSSRTVTALTDTVCYCLERVEFTERVGKLEELWRFKALSQVPLLHSLTDAQIYDLQPHMREVRFAKGDWVFHQGDPADGFYMVSSGSLAISSGTTGEILRCIEDGDCFGEGGLLRAKQTRAASVRVTSESAICLKIGVAEFRQHLGELDELRSLWAFTMLQRVPLLRRLGLPQVWDIAKRLDEAHYLPGEVIITRGEVGNEFFLVECGTCYVAEDPTYKLSAGSFFGELALLQDDALRKATVVAETDVTCWVMAREGFAEVLAPVHDALAQKRYVVLGEGEGAGTTEVVGVDMALEDLLPLGVLGEGKYGVVSLVRHRTSGLYYALKILGKRHLLAEEREGMVAQIKLETEILAELESPFVVKLEATMQDDYHIYMVMEAVMGGDMFDFMSARGSAVTERVARFYSGCVVLALEHLHARNYVYRDLKLENLLMEPNGYVKLADMGACVKLMPGERSYTLRGTPNYLAPEQIAEHGTTSAVDWWALGVVLYEMVSGQEPFNTPDGDFGGMIERIEQVRYPMPKHFSPELEDLIRCLLVRNPSARLGNKRRGAADVKEHAFYQGLDWSRLSMRELESPLCAKVRDPQGLPRLTDVTHRALEQQPITESERALFEGLF